jgi:hypothetical protein
VSNLRSTVIKLPDFVLEIWNKKQEDIQKRISETVVLDMVRKHEISAGKGAELLNMDRWEFWELMSKNDVPHVDLSDTDFDQSLDAGRSI